MTTTAPAAQDPGPRAARTGTGSRFTRVFGVLTLAMMAVQVLLEVQQPAELE